MASRAAAVTDPRPIPPQVAFAAPATPETRIRLLLLGAAGRLGRQVLDRLDPDGPEVVAVGRDARPEALVGDRDVVVNVAAATPPLVTAWATAGSHAGGYLDLAPTEASHRALEGRSLGPAPVVPGAGFASAVGDALAVVAGRTVAAPVRVDVTLFVPSRRSLLAGATPRERAELLEALMVPMRVRVDGRHETERVGQARRLAWFPRPVGPHHAAAVPGTHWRTVPRVLPSVATVRTALAVRSSTAEVLQGMGNLARLEAGRRWLARRAARPGRDRGTVGERWAIVVEVAAASGLLARGWAYGHDRHALTAQAGALLAPRIGTADATTSGVPVGPTEIAPAEALLDALAAHTDLRWSVTEPVAVP